MAGYIGSKASVTQVDGYRRSEADAEFVQVSGDTMTGDLNFGDNDKATFGGSSDLRIYHDGGNSYIHDAGVGNLYVRSNVFRVYNAAGTEISANFVQNGAVTLYHDNSVKIATTSIGVDVTGTITANQFVGGGAIILVDDQSDGTNYTTTSTNYQVATRFQVTPSSSTSRLMGWFYCQMRAISGQSDGDMGNTARVHYLNSSGSWVASGNVAQNFRTETGTSTGIKEISVTFPILLNQDNLNASGVWDVAIRHYELYDATSNIDDGRFYYMEYEP